MLLSLKQSYGNSLEASDGEIGQVKDFYFDDEKWAVRYLMVDTGSWLPGRRVLISPLSVGRFDQAAKILRVNLTRKQIESSPSLESHKPVSRQYEEDYHRHYGWPGYWQGDGLWGVSSFPILEVPAKPFSNGTAAPDGPHPERADAHLRSTQAVSGYHLQASDGMIGHVCDFMMDAESWAIRQVVVKIGHRFSGKEVLIPTRKVERISYPDSSMYVNLTREAVEKSAAQGPAPAGAVG